ncbi:MAG: dihydrodipicolinate synthase family protein [Arenicellales bacterium WSBS_2016_MAG_OTU3]
MPDLSGVCTPICTIFTEDGSRIDEPAMRAHVDTLLEAGIHIICACGGTGEFSFLTRAERLQIAAIVGSQIDGRARFMVHTSAVMTEETIEFSKHAQDLGADALLVLPPYFEGPTMDGVYEHYERVAAAIDTAIMAYNIPVHSGINLTPEFVHKLKQIESIQYLKDSTGDFIALQEFIAAAVNVFVGADPLMLHGLMAGASGGFWGASNAIPREAVMLYEYCAAGQFDQAHELWKKIYALNQFIWSNPFNPSVKAAANLLGQRVGNCRRPVQPLTPNEHSALEQVISTLQ